MRSYLLFYIATLCFLFTPLKYSTMIYQQNHYHQDRYVHWLRHQLCQQRFLRIFLCMFTFLILLFLPQNFQREGMLLWMFIVAYISYKIEQQMKYRVPLKYTHRIKRFLVVQCILLAVLSALLLYVPVSILIVLIPLYYVVPFFLVLLASFLVEPIEKAIQAHFLKEAKQLLRSHKDCICIGITGSFGKTSVKNIIYALVSENYHTLMTPKSYNNKMGITVTIRQSLHAMHELFLCEMGADHVGEITEMMRFVRPEIGIVTAVGPQHLLTFHSIENILREKMQMIELLPPQGIGFLNADNDYIRSYALRNTCRIIWYGRDPLCDYRLKDITYHANGMDITLQHDDETVVFTTILLGEHNAYNLCCSIAVAHTLGVSFDRLKELVAKVPYTQHRLQIVATSPYTLIDDAYNANPVGANNALEVLAKMEERTIIVTPGMIDLGETQDHENYLFGKHMAHCVQEVVLVGQKATAFIKKGLIEEGYAIEKIHVCDTFQEAMNFVSSIVHEGDVVLLENDLPDAFAH